ncbi:restriction endonuclease subunit S [bacterium]|nr:restriction endonuclease subunit S [bacterium]
MRLDKVIKSISVANAAVKNTASPVKIDGWYPAYSASGQDVWLPNYRFDKKGIVVSAVGARCGKAFKADGKWNICANTHALIVDEALADRDYCWYMLNNENWWIKGGSAQPFVKVKDSLKREHNFPPIAKQKIIVQKLNTVASLINLRQKEITILDNLIKARFVEMFGNPVINDKGWKQKFLGDTTLKIGSGATPRGGKEAYQEKGISFIRSMNVHNGRFEYKELAHISDKLAEELNNVTVNKNDVLLNITGASVARSCVVPSNVLPARVNQHVCIIRCKECLIPEFLNELLINDDSQKMLWIIAGSGATREAITKQQVENLQIILPPIELQNEFVIFSKKIEELKINIKNVLASIQLLYNKLMHIYFD